MKLVTSRLILLVLSAFVAVRTVLEVDQPAGKVGTGPDAQLRSKSIPVRKKLVEAYDKLPMSFELNRGQTDKSVRFLSRGRGYSLFLTSTEAVLALAKTSKESASQPAVLRMQVLGGNSGADVAGADELPGATNYFLGDDPTRWRLNVPSYGRVRYNRVYPGIDLVYYGQGRELEYDFIVKPGADPNQIRLHFEGARNMTVDTDGNLVLQVDEESIRLLKPAVYQEVNGTRLERAGVFAVRQG